MRGEYADLARCEARALNLRPAGRDGAVTGTRVVGGRPVGGGTLLPSGFTAPASEAGIGRGTAGPAALEPHARSGVAAVPTPAARFGVAAAAAPQTAYAVVAGAAGDPPAPG